MTFRKAIKALNETLFEKRPKHLTSSWISTNTPQIYRYIQKNIRTENNDIDWDRVTVRLDREYQKKW